MINNSLGGFFIDSGACKARFVEAEPPELALVGALEVDDFIDGGYFQLTEPSFHLI